MFRSATLATLLIVLPIAWRSASAGPPVPPDAEVQRPGLVVPPGFEVQLVACDPDIGQPMNLAFDAKGRLWVTHTVEYPYPAAGPGVETDRGRFPGVGDHPPRDRLSVFTIGPDGRATSCTHFATGLNIPIGQTPLGAGESALVYGIPSIVRVDDTDGDGVADATETVYTRFGNKDVHGNASSFRPWIDGWVYGCHGFSNVSEITDGSGTTTKLVSGNTYRFKADGGRFEPFTHGQVNPFGLTFDPMGNLYSADCHSSPLTLLIPGATYPHFGNATPGLGFGPTMIDHSHGSTGICGPAYYAADHFPEEYRNTIFLCNPVTRRIHWDKLIWTGSTPRVDTQPDFVATEDPWFRPVDLTVGPDGALYVADFCNLVIGHYEAPLDDPDRDGTHGRIWRIVWKGLDGTVLTPTLPDLTAETTAQLVARLGDDNLTVRTLATNLLIERHDFDTPFHFNPDFWKNSPAAARAHALWVLERWTEPAGTTFRDMTIDDPLVRVQILRILAGRPAWGQRDSTQVRSHLEDENAFVRRAAAEALARHPQPRNVPALLAARRATDPADTHLAHTIKLALAAQLTDPTVVAALLDPPSAGAVGADQHLVDTVLAGTPAAAADRAVLVELAAAVGGPVAAEVVLRWADGATLPPDVLDRAATAIAEAGRPEQLARLVEVAPVWLDGRPERQIALLTAVTTGLTRRGVPPTDEPALKAWLARLAPDRLTRLADGPAWTELPRAGQPEEPSPWGVRTRACADGRTDVPFLDSIVGGETRTGRLRSRPFALPETLTFWLCGHNGPPATDGPTPNRVTLRDAATDAVLAEASPPRSDVAVEVRWTLPEHVGTSVVLDVEDGHTATAYAWLAIGRVDVPGLEVTPAVDDATLIDLVGRLRLTDQVDRLAAIVADGRHPQAVRSAALTALGRWGEAGRVTPTLLTAVADPAADVAWRAEAATALGGDPSEATTSALAKALDGAPTALARPVAEALARSPAGLSALLRSVGEGKASARLLTDPAVAARIAGTRTPEHQATIAAVVAALPPEDARIGRRIAAARTAFVAAEPDAARGQAAFTKHCAACHKIGTAGATVGPQLDGVGHRGLDRLLEDVLDPGRNVDAAFRTTTLALADGRIVTGLVRREEGQTVVLADEKGREAVYPAAEIEDRRAATGSLMPANFGDVLSDAELADLLRFLLVQTAAPPGDAAP